MTKPKKKRIKPRGKKKVRSWKRTRATASSGFSINLHD